MGLASAAETGAFYVSGDFYTAINVAGLVLTGEGTSDVFVRAARSVSSRKDQPWPKGNAEQKRTGTL